MLAKDALSQVKAKTSALLLMCLFVASMGATILGLNGRAYAGTTAPGCYDAESFGSSTAPYPHIVYWQKKTPDPADPNNCKRATDAGTTIEPNFCYFLETPPGGVFRVVKSGCGESVKCELSTDVPYGDNNYFAPNKESCDAYVKLHPESASSAGLTPPTLTKVPIAGSTDKLSAIFGNLQLVINVLTLLIGAALVGSTIFAGVQYTSSAGDPSKAQKAITRITSNIIVLAALISIAVLLNWIIPA